MEGKKPLIIGVAVLGIIIAIIILVILVVVFKKYFPSSGNFAGFCAKLRGLDSYMDVDPLANFFFQNRELRKKLEMGTIQIDEVYYIYKSFVNHPKLQNVPVDILREAAVMVSFMESSRDFTIPDTTDFRTLGMAIIGMDRLLVTYLDSLKIGKNKVGGTDSNQEKVFNDYQRVNSLGTGYVEGVLNNIDIDGYYGPDKKAAQKMKEDISEQIGLQLQMDRADPLKYEYQNSLSDNMDRSGKYKTAQELYIDKRFPGTAERRQIRDEPIYKPEKDYKDPNVPRPGIIGKIADVPYHYDIHAKNYVRSY